MGYIAKTLFGAAKRQVFGQCCKMNKKENKHVSFSQGLILTKFLFNIMGDIFAEEQLLMKQQSYRQPIAFQREAEVLRLLQVSTGII